MRLLLLCLILPALSASAAGAELAESYEDRLARLEHRGDHMDLVGGGSLLCAVVCALWAQNTARNSWLWFFMGLIFSLITVFVMLHKNAGDIKAQKRMAHSSPHS